MHKLSDGEQMNQSWDLFLNGKGVLLSLVIMEIEWKGQILKKKKCEQRKWKVWVVWEVCWNTKIISGSWNCPNKRKLFLSIFLYFGLKYLYTSVKLKFNMITPALIFIISTPHFCFRCFDNILLMMRWLAKIATTTILITN
jgi:hypothetical protein